MKKVTCTAVISLALHELMVIRVGPMSRATSLIGENVPMEQNANMTTGVPIVSSLVMAF